MLGHRLRRVISSRGWPPIGKLHVQMARARDRAKSLIFGYPPPITATLIGLSNGAQYTVNALVSSKHTDAAVGRTSLLCTLANYRMISLAVFHLEVPSGRQVLHPESSRLRSLSLS